MPGTVLCDIKEVTHLTLMASLFLQMRKQVQKGIYGTGLR